MDDPPTARLTDPDNDRSPRRRRALLAAIGAGLVGGFAGCGSDGGGTSTAPTTTQTASTTTTPSSTTATPTRTATESTTTTSTPTSTEATTTRPPTTVTYGRELLTTPGSAISPRAGFATTDWMATRPPAIHRVTSLAGEGSGTLRAALETTGPRLVIFEVGGVVDLQGSGIEVADGHLFVAGQTAPPPGITVIRGGIEVDAANAVVQHIRVRPGDDISGPTDALSVGESGRNVIFDHCSVTWGTDEVMSSGGSPDNHTVTFSNNIIAECLSNSIHPAGEHSKGTLVMNNARRVAVLGNFYADNRARNPRLKGGTSTVVVNNHVYHFENAITMGGDSTEDPVAAVVGNRWERGPEKRIIEDATEPDNEARAYVKNNAVVPFSAPMTGEGITVVDSEPVWPAGLGTIPVDDVLAHTFQSVGARPIDRTHHDQRVIDQIMNRTETFIDSQEEVGGYPDLESTQRTLDPPAPGEGLADWLYQHTRAVELEDASPP